MNTTSDRLLTSRVPSVCFVEKGTPRNVSLADLLLDHGLLPPYNGDRPSRGLRFLCGHPVMRRSLLRDTSPRKGCFSLIDIHCHILPGIDDGADDWEQSIRMARLAAEDGISGLVCTPHWSPAFPGNTRDAILPLVDEFRDRLRRENIELDVFAGCEAVISFGLESMFESGELLTVNDGGAFALVETPYEIIPPNVERLFWMMQVKGITPIMAHPERNARLIRDPMILMKWVEAGVLVQITAGSLEGIFGGDVREYALDLLRRRMVHFVASDAHNAGRRAPTLSEAREIAASVIGPEEAERIFTLHPSCVVRGELPEVEDPLPPDEKKPSLMGRLFPFW